MKMGKGNYTRRRNKREDNEDGREGIRKEKNQKIMKMRKGEQARERNRGEDMEEKEMQIRRKKDEKHAKDVLKEICKQA